MKKLAMAVCLVLLAGFSAHAGMTDVTVVNQSSSDIVVERAAGPHGWMPEGLVLPANGGSATYGVPLAPGETAMAILASRDGGRWHLVARADKKGNAVCELISEWGSGGAGVPDIQDGKGQCRIILPWPKAGKDPSFKKMP